MTRVPHALAAAVPAPAGTAVPPPAGTVSPGGFPPRRSPRVIASALVALTKPRIIELLLVTTVPTMLLAQRGMPSIRLVLVTLIGGTLAAGSANTINCYIDRDIDAVMKRTSRRPLVVNGHGTIKPWEALAWGILLGAGATLLLGLMANWLAASLADAAILFYIFVYTLLLKRRSPSNIVIGGAARCFPVLVGWAAVTGKVGVPAVVLFAVIFLWTPPLLALAMKFRKDYAAANVPMLPVVAIARRGRAEDPLVLLRHGGGHAGADPVRRLDLRRAGRGPGRLVPGRGARPGHQGQDGGRRGRARTRLDAPVPPVHRVPDPAVRRGGGDRPAAVGPLVTAGSRWPCTRSLVTLTRWQPAAVGTSAAAG